MSHQETQNPTTHDVADLAIPDAQLSSGEGRAIRAATSSSGNARRACLR